MSFRGGLKLGKNSVRDRLNAPPVRKANRSIHRLPLKGQGVVARLYRWLANSLGCFGHYFDFHVLDAILSALVFGKIQMPKKLQHTSVLAHHHRVEKPNLFVSR